MMVGAGSKYAGVASSLLGVLASGFFASHIAMYIFPSIESQKIHRYKTPSERRDRKKWIVLDDDLIRQTIMPAPT